MVQAIVSFDNKVLEHVYIHKLNVEGDVKEILSQNVVKNDELFAAWLLKAASLIDLTTLAGDDTRANVTRLCKKAANPLSSHVSKELGFKEGEHITTAAVCVYPSRVTDAYQTLKLLGLTEKIQIAAVATGFPSGLYPLETRLHEIQYAVLKGATEIDVVIDRSLALTGKWKELHDEIVQMKKSCGKAHLKVILGVGELGSLNNVYKASMVSMMAGADFIKTSTGKEAVNATLPVGLVMCRAIKHYYRMTQKKIGLKPAGGIKTPKDVVDWLIMVKTELGPEWLNPSLFRIGASSLLGAIEKHLHDYVYKGSSNAAKFNFI